MDPLNWEWYIKTTGDRKKGHKGPHRGFGFPEHENDRGNRQKKKSRQRSGGKSRPMAKNSNTLMTTQDDGGQHCPSLISGRHLDSRRPEGGAILLQARKRGTSGNMARHVEHANSYPGIKAGGPWGTSQKESPIKGLGTAYWFETLTKKKETPTNDGGEPRSRAKGEASKLFRKNTSVEKNPSFALTRGAAAKGAYQAKKIPQRGRIFVQHSAQRGKCPPHPGCRLQTTKAGAEPNTEAQQDRDVRANERTKDLEYGHCVVRDTTIWLVFLTGSHSKLSKRGGGNRKGIITTDTKNGG